MLSEANGKINPARVINQDRVNFKKTT